MLRGYFFPGRSREKLVAVVPELEAQGYRFVDVFMAEGDEGEPKHFFLHVEREEAHSSQSLDARNRNLYALASQHQLDSYDGMDVGPVTHR